MILITGADGQVGRTLKDTAPPDLKVYYANKTELDITNRTEVYSFVKNLGVSGLINVAAYNAVDLAETDKVAAYLVNAQGIENLGRCSTEFGFPIVHVSTDYIFSGDKSEPYKPSDLAKPINVYGESKLEGENRLRKFATNWAIVRTSWVYSHYRSNLVKNILQMMNERDSLSMVDDQFNSPTWAKSLAQILWTVLLRNPKNEILHWCDSEVTSPYKLALAIQNEALSLGLLEQSIPIHPIHLADYKTKAKRPAYSALYSTDTYEKFGISPKSWRSNLKSMLEDLKSFNSKDFNSMEFKL